MRRVFGRLLFAAFAIGQLQLVPAAIACVREHRQPAVASHCAEPAVDRMTASVAPSRTDAGPLCAVLGPCAMSGPAISARLVSPRIVVAETEAATPAQPSRPASFDLTPPAPPPEA